MAEEILDSVRSKYGAVAESTLSTNDEGVKAVAEAFGYARRVRPGILAGLLHLGQTHHPHAFATTRQSGRDGAQERTGRHRKEVTGDIMLKVIFACIHNAGRSQMAAAFFSQLADPHKAQAVSAGTEPGVRVHPEVQAVMHEVGIDLSSAKPQKLTEEMAKDAQLLITMGCGDKCPYVPGLRREDWPLLDPKGLPREEVRLIRDEVRQRVQELVNREHV